MKNQTIRITALLTGRGNNTLPDKNILSVLGKPLLGYPCEAAKNSRFIDDFWVSSDCEKILSAAYEYGFEPIKRPDELGLPTAQHEDVIEHALKELEKKNKKPDILIVLLANSVTIKTEWIDACVNHLLLNKEATSSVPVYKNLDHHPFRAKKLNKDGYLIPFFNFEDEKISTNRQDLPPSFFLSHNFWVLNLNRLNKSIGYKPWTFMGDKVMYYEVDEAFDVHNMEDVERSEEWLKREF